MAEPVTLQSLLTYITLISVPVGVFYHIMTLRNTRKKQELQLETRQAQMFYGVYNRMSQADFIEAWNAFEDWEFKDYDEAVQTLYGKENRRYARTLGVYFEGLGVLVRLGLVPIHYIAYFITNMTRTYWEKQATFIEEFRARENVPRALSEVEFLYDELMKYLEEHPELKT